MDLNRIELNFTSLHGPITQKEKRWNNTIYARDIREMPNKPGVYHVEIRLQPALGMTIRLVFLSNAKAIGDDNDMKDAMDQRGFNFPTPNPAEYQTQIPCNVVTLTRTITRYNKREVLHKYQFTPDEILDKAATIQIDLPFKRQQILSIDFLGGHE